MFYIYAVLLSLFALAFVIYPLLIARPENRVVDRQAENLKAYKQQINELTQAYNAGEFDDADRDAMEQELKLKLLEDSDRVANPKPLDAKKPFGLIAVLGVIGVLGSFVYYQTQGNVADIALQEAFEQASSSPEAELRYLELLEDKLQNTPDDIEGLWSLGSAYMNHSRFSDAATAYAKALAALDRVPEAYAEDRSALMTYVVQARFFANDRVLAPVDVAYLKEALQLDPMNSMAVGISGIAAYESGDYTTAILQWRRLAEISPADAASVRSAIAAAESRLVELGMPVPEQAAPAAVAGPSIIVQLDLDQALAVRAVKAKALFVLARIAGGPPMPVAVRNLSSFTFPLSVVLDASAAMGPMAGIQAGTTVEVVARLSMAGSAAAQSGDLEIISAPIKVGDDEQTIGLMINTIVP